MSGEDTEFLPREVPTRVDDQTFRAEVLRTIRDMAKKIDGIVDRLHAGDVRLAEHAQRLERQEEQLEVEVAALKRRVEELEKSLQAEKDRNLETRTRFGVVWAALAALATLAGGTLWALITSKGHA